MHLLKVEVHVLRLCAAIISQYIFYISPDCTLFMYLDDLHFSFRNLNHIQVPLFS